ncbi:hypothetical protein T4E_7471 [Trichinella pseudospiralis]|uniref:Uncharacterized protein n=1 Tax=Trichinella pseudospiralis TaxID=6337 RepID=A0A0V0XLZ2_TRIPS|nr:hypothetical protein T4E_7471 [Trichinella pseudospiralis]
MSSTARTRSKKLAVNKYRLNKLLDELEELCSASTDTEIEDQFAMTERGSPGGVGADPGGGRDAERIRGMVEVSEDLQTIKGCRSCKPGRSVSSHRERETAAVFWKSTGLLPPPPHFGTLWDRSDLDGTAQFAYLLSCLTGKARGAIEEIPVTAANHAHAVEILRNRFGRPEKVAREHILTLCKAPECREMTPQSIQSLVDELTTNLKCLTALDKDPFT